MQCHHPRDRELADRMIFRLLKRMRPCPLLASFSATIMAKSGLMYYM
jgi:hypothetical protein